MDVDKPGYFDDSLSQMTSLRLRIRERHDLW